MSSGLMRFRLFVSVSVLDENTRSEGTEDAWIGRKSREISKNVGSVDSLNYCMGHLYISIVISTK